MDSLGNVAIGFLFGFETARNYRDISPILRALGPLPNKLLECFRLTTGPAILFYLKYNAKTNRYPSCFEYR